MQPAPVVKNLLEEDLRLSLKKLAEEAKARFAKISYFPTSVWDDIYWVHQGNDRIYFLDDGVLSDELALLNKVFLMTYLWNSRVRNKPLGAARVKNLVAGLKLLTRANANAVGLTDINQDTYSRTLRYIEATFASGEGLCNNLNLLVKYLKANGLLSNSINVIRGSALGQRTDEHGRVALEEKLPLPELVRAIIHLKWAVEDQWDGSARAQLDMLSILTQVFQYGLGLRIGEVLRLPKDCLVEINGQLFCKVWTEKGAEPVARYIPTVWRAALQDTVDRINSICDRYRAQAEKIENGTIVEGLDSRFKNRIDTIEAELQSALDQLTVLSERNAAVAKERLTLLKLLADDELVELKRLSDYLPLASTATDTSSLVKFYKNSGFEVVSESIGTFKHKHYVRGEDVKRRLSELIEFRRGVVTFDELFVIIHGRRPKDRRVKSSHILGLSQSRNLSAFEWFAISGLRGNSGIASLYFNCNDAATAIANAIGGGYDYKKFLPLLDAEQLYPEFFSQKTITTIKRNSARGFFSHLRLLDEKTTFFRKTTSAKSLNYTSGHGYLLEYSSIEDAISKNFVAINTKIQAELIEEIQSEILSEGLNVSSKSFEINQKVSDYLFVVPSSLGGVYNEHIPCVLGYFAVLYSIKPAKKGREVKSAFTRYGVRVDDDVISSFQTHKGRHWQTNSLFRAGLAASIVNKWMGRTEIQGDHYDHQTARERAAKVGALMLSEQSRFIGELPEKIKHWKKHEIPIQDLEAHLSLTIQTAHYGPLGFCIRDVNLKPCEYHLKCLTGNNGLGCREFVFDLHDPTQRRNVEAERDKAENELARLFEVMNRPDVPIESVEMHIEHQMTVYRNATSIIQRSELILTKAQADQVQDFQPFRSEGSKPDDCAFQCGGEQ